MIETNNNNLITKLLLNIPSVDVNIRDPAGNTPIMYGALLDNKQMVADLIEMGADVNLCNNTGNTALHNAASNNAIKTIVLLLERGAKVAKNKDGISPLDLISDLEGMKLLRGKKTSLSHPYVINFIDKTTCPALNQARIGMSMCPGRVWGEWDRDIDIDISVILSHKIQVVCSIITNTELSQMNRPDFYQRIRLAGMESVDFSIHDKWLPNSVDNFIKIVDVIVEHIRRGKTILVHCNGGKGRTGLVVVACLMILGYPVDQSIQIIRTARSGMLRNPAQEVFLHALKSKLQDERPAPQNTGMRRAPTLRERISNLSPLGDLRPISPLRETVPLLSPREQKVKMDLDIEMSEKSKSSERTTNSSKSTEVIKSVEGERRTLDELDIIQNGESRKSRNSHFETSRKRWIENKIDFVPNQEVEDNESNSESEPLLDLVFPPPSDKMKDFKEDIPENKWNWDENETNPWASPNG
eukprot:TRINITY_DN7429_c1_g1_i1.p1 TRINITY_DN7429_c1_g1~~TRINITY_DN7429_c1_g1_i1.p1  ORF type:complete len:470 (+),score=99.03 TRINITY_DN7429_c1_g1_i1:493-1902(+)